MIAAQPGLFAFVKITTKLISKKMDNAKLTAPEPTETPSVNFNKSNIITLYLIDLVCIICMDLLSSISNKM